MIVSKLKPWPEMETYLAADNNIFILGCNGCAQSSGTGGAAQVTKMKDMVETAGKIVTGTSVVDFLCQETLVASRLRPRTEECAARSAASVCWSLPAAFAPFRPVPSLCCPAPAAGLPTVNVSWTRKNPAAGS